MRSGQGVPSVGTVLHHDWTRKVFRHLPEDAEMAGLVDASYCFPGTVLHRILSESRRAEDLLLVQHHPEAPPPRRKTILWRGATRLVPESLSGLFGPRYGRIAVKAYEKVLPRLGFLAVLRAESDPTYLVGLPELVVSGIGHEELERLLDAPVAVATQGHYATAGFVPSLRFYVGYDGARYGDSSKKLFYDRKGNAVSVELVAREILSRMAYDVVHPALFARLFRVVTGRSPVDFHPEVWPRADPRRSPLAAVATAAARLDAIEADPAGATLGALEALAQRKPYAAVVRPRDALPLVARFLSRRRLEDLLEALGPKRYLAILRGMLAGQRVVEADWFAWQRSTHRAFPVEVKSRGDTLRPSQKESILFCQSTGILEYRLLEVLHGKEAGAEATAAATVEPAT